MMRGRGGILGPDLSNIGRDRTPAQIEQVMSKFNLIRQREADGTVDHVLEFFLVGPDGRQLYQYAASHAEPTTIAGDIRREAKIGTVSRVDSASQRVPL